jgi:hypothetical protein
MAGSPPNLHVHTWTTQGRPDGLSLGQAAGLIWEGWHAGLAPGCGKNVATI